MAETNKERIDRLIKLNQEGADSARKEGKEPAWAKPKKFAKGGMVSGRDSYGKKR